MGRLPRPSDMFVFFGIRLVNPTDRADLRAQPVETNGLSSASSDAYSKEASSSLPKLLDEEGPSAPSWARDTVWVAERLRVERERVRKGKMVSEIENFDLALEMDRRVLRGVAGSLESIATT